MPRLVLTIEADNQPANPREEHALKYLVRDIIILATQSIAHQPFSGDFTGAVTGVSGARAEYQFSVKPERRNR